MPSYPAGVLEDALGAAQRQGIAETVDSKTGAEAGARRAQGGLSDASRRGEIRTHNVAKDKLGLTAR